MITNLELQAEARARARDRLAEQEMPALVEREEKRRRRQLAAARQEEAAMLARLAEQEKLIASLKADYKSAAAEFIELSQTAAGVHGNTRRHALQVVMRQLPDRIRAVEIVIENIKTGRLAKARRAIYDLEQALQIESDN